MKKYILILSNLFVFYLFGLPIKASLLTEEETISPQPTPFITNATPFIEIPDLVERDDDVIIQALSINCWSETLSYLEYDLTTLYRLKEYFGPKIPSYAWNPHFKKAYTHQAEIRQQQWEQTHFRSASLKEARSREFLVTHKAELPQFSECLQTEIENGILVTLQDKTVENNDLAFLKVVKNLDISKCQNITHEGLQQIPLVEKLTASSCTRLRGAGFATLSQLKEITLFGCKWLRDNDLRYFSQATQVNIGACGISDEGIAHLTHVKILDISFCHGVSNTMKALLRQRGVTVVDRHP